MNSLERFGFAFAPRYRAAALPFGVRPGTAWVDVGDEALTARFGPWRLSTLLANVTDVAVAAKVSVGRPLIFSGCCCPGVLILPPRSVSQ